MILTQPVSDEPRPEKNFRFITRQFLPFQKDVKTANAMKISEDLKNLSYKNPKKTPAGDINNIATILEKIAAVKEKTNEVSYGCASSSELSFDIIPFLIPYWPRD